MVHDVGDCDVMVCVSRGDFFWAVDVREIFISFLFCRAVIYNAR